MPILSCSDGQSSRAKVYNTSLVEQFFQENAGLLPAGANPENQIARKIDGREGTVALILDFRACFVTVR